MSESRGLQTSLNVPGVGVQTKQRQGRAAIKQEKQKTKKREYEHAERLFSHQPFSCKGGRHFQSM